MSASNLFPEKPTIYFASDISTCCNKSLQVQKTRSRTVATLDIGEFGVRETVLVCKECDGIYISDELSKLVPPRCKFGFDVLIYVGKAIFLQCRNDKEIIQQLWSKNIRISSSEIAYLAKKFIIYLALAHRQSSRKIKKNMAIRGGYILHLDATCDGESPHLMSGLDEITEIILHNVKLPSESAEKIIPFLRDIKQSYNNPLAVVSDMGKGISNAVEKVFPGLPQFICHYHFLRDIGGDLFGEENDIIRKRLTFHGIQGVLRTKIKQFKKIIDIHPGLVECLSTNLENGRIEQSTLEQMPVATAYTLALWALEGKKQTHGYGFPFDRPYLVFYQRLKTLFSECQKLQKISMPVQTGNKNPFFVVCKLLRNTISDTTLRKKVLQMQEKVFVFDKLRKAMRIASPEQNQGLNDDGEDADIKTIKEGVKNFRNRLLKDARFSKNKDYKKMIEQINKYWKKLFADSITVETSQGKKTIQPQRTNNILERFFRDIRRRHRKKSGTNSLGKTLKAMLADTPLVYNLENREYLDILLNGKATLEERFAEIDSQTIREELRKSRDDSEKIPPKINVLIKEQQLPQKLVQFFNKQMKAHTTE